MNEKPKSIWKKSWTGWRGYLGGWLILMATLAVILLIELVTMGTSLKMSGDDVLKLFVVPGIAVTVIFFLAAFIRWLCSRRNFKRFLFGLACFATLIALFYAEEDWRGWHAWNQFKRQWEAKGEKFDWQSIVPPPVPDDQNFAFSPVWMAEVRYNFLNTPIRAEVWYGNRIYSDEVSKVLLLLPVSDSALVGTNWAYRLPPTPQTSGNWAAGRMTDLKPWQTYYRDFEKTNPKAEIPVAPQPKSPAADVLLALSKFDPVIEQLRQDSARSYSRFPIGYDDADKASILLPHLAALKRCSLVLQLRAIAELQNGETDKAFADVKLALRLVDSIRTEPFLISHLVRIAMLQITLQPIYEGAANHQWTEAQLTGLESELAKLDLVADYRLAMHGEMGLQNGIFDLLQHHPEQLPSLSSAGNGGNASPPFLAKVLYHLIPSGWFYQNHLHCARPMVELYLPVADVSQDTVSPAKVKKADAEIKAQTQHRTIFNIFERLMLPALSNASKRFAYGQSAVDLARTAIALERYRLAHGEYPASLEPLAPLLGDKVPHDVINGGPLLYRLASDGQFVLYSVGWNERDDGGVVVLTKGSTPVVDINQGDWVWRYPAK